MFQFYSVCAASASFSCRAALFASLSAALSFARSVIFPTTWLISSTALSISAPYSTVNLIISSPFTFLIPCNTDIICYDGHVKNIINGFQKNFVNFSYLYSFILEVFTYFLTTILFEKFRFK